MKIYTITVIAFVRRRCILSLGRIAEWEDDLASWTVAGVDMVQGLLDQNRHDRFSGNAWPSGRRARDNPFATCLIYEALSGF